MRLDDKIRGLVWAALLLMLPLTACDTDALLEVIDPDTVNPVTLEDPSTIPLQIAGAVGDFQRAYSGSGGDAFLSSVALMSDELLSSGTFSTRTALDRRNLQDPSDGNTPDGAYSRLHIARRALKDAVVFVTEAEPGNPDIAEMKALEGYTYVALAEGWCGPLPFSDVVDGERVDGDPIGTTEIYNQAIARFDLAISEDMAKVGKGRALLNLGNLSGAAAAVSGVATSFVYYVEHSDNSSGQTNPIFSLQQNGRYSQSNLEGGDATGLAFRAGDPRTPWFEDPLRGFDKAFPLYVSQRYTSENSGVVLADGIEARLIEAEADMSGNPAAWLAKLNALRADVANLMAARYDDYADNVPGATLAPLTDPGTTAGRVDMMFSERAFWLFITGHRIGDMRRLVNQYGRTPNSVYPSGAYHKGGNHGTSVVFSVDFDEANNLLYDPSTCNTDSTS